MSTRNVDELMEELYSIVERAWHLPLSGGRAMVDGNEVRQLLDELRDNLPQETRQARAIVADRNQIIADAKREAESIIRNANERRNHLIEQDEITRQAQQKAAAILRKANNQSEDMRKACTDFVDDLMRRTEDTLAENLAELRKTRQNIKNAQLKKRG